MTDVTRFFEDLVRYETRLYNAVSDRVRAEHGVGLGTYELLDVVDRVSGCRVLDLVRALAITVGAASKAVDRAVDAGLCHRTPHPQDRRSSVLHLTPAGAALLVAARPTVRAELAARTSTVPAESLRRAAATIGALRAAIEEEQRGRDDRAGGTPGPS